MVIIDPFISSHQVTENDNNAIDLVAKKWAEIADVTDCAVELVHHTKKSGGAEVTVEDGRGASSLIGAARAAQVINQMSENEAAKAGVQAFRQYFKVEDGKRNLAPPIEGYEWYRIVERHIGNGEPSNLLDLGDSVGVVTAWKWPDPLDGITNVDFEKAAQAIRAGKWRENVQAKDWVGRAVAKALALDLDDRAGKAKALGLVKAWLAAGSLVIVEGEDEKRMPRKFIEVREEP